MSRWTAFLVFAAVALSLAGIVHYYLWARLVRDLALPQTWHRVLSALAVALFVSIPFTFWLGRRAPFEQARIGTFPGYVWMGAMFLLLVLVLLVDAGRLVVRIAEWIGTDRPPADPDRRTAVARVLGAGIALVAGTATAAGVRSALGSIDVKEIHVALARLPRALSGMKIVQLTDLHVGPSLGRDFVEAVVERANALEPDVVAITGDLVDGPVRKLRDEVAPLAKLRAKHGVYFVTGNHEYYSGVESWCRELARLGVRVLRNERVAVGEGDVTIDLAGVDDWSAGRFGRGHGPNLAAALDGRDPSRELVLLAHQPRQVHEAEKHGVGLQLSGHTHGGQLFPWNFLVRLSQPVVSGLARIGRTLVYVSNGTGFWGPPIRLGAPAEVTKIVLAATDGD